MTNLGLTAIDGQIVRQEIPDSIGEKYLSVLVNPKSGNDLKPFLSFAKKYLAKSGTQVTAFQLRMAYADSLGTATVYRGVGLGSNAEADDIRKDKGFVSVGMEEKDGLATFVEKLLDSEHADSYYGELELHRAGDFDAPRAATYMLSTTDYSELAAAVGYQYSTHKDKEVYVFKMQIPRIDLLEQTNSFANFRFKSTNVFVFADKLKIPMTDPGVERLVYLVDIAPKQILSWEKAGKPSYSVQSK